MLGEAWSPFSRCRSGNAASSKTAIQSVSARATANHVSQGQIVVDAKCNEIAAIPNLLPVQSFPDR
jgi:hypothetical protein